MSRSINKLNPTKFLLAAAGLMLLGLGYHDPADQHEQGKEALLPLQPFVGSWKGVGQVRRGSNDGAWIAKAEWCWHFDREHAEMQLQTADGKFFKSAVVEIAKSNDAPFVMVATLPDERGEQRYQGTLDEQTERLTFTAAGEVADGVPARVSLRLVARGDRLLMTYEKRLGSTDRFAHLAEVGYTRQGSDFGQGGVSRECVVTGGAGTMAVSHDGKTYYVCCTGCRQLFYEDPEGVLADYRQRKEEEKQARSKS